MRPAYLIRQASLPLILAAFIAAVIALRGWIPGIERPPSTLLINLEAPLNMAVRSVAEWAQPFFRFLSWLLSIPIDWLRTGLASLPWFVFVTLAALAAHAAGGIRLAVHGGRFFYVAVTGYWSQTMMTLAIVGVAVPISVATGLAIGIIAHRVIGVRRVIEPVLDLMQTVPTFAYLIPMLVLFGVGPVVGMLASAIYAIPPMVRSVILGLERIPGEVIECWPHGWRHALANALARKASNSAPRNSPRSKSDGHGRAQHGGHRLDSWRFSGHWLGGLQHDEERNLARVSSPVLSSCSLPWCSIASPGDSLCARNKASSRDATGLRPS